MLKELVHKNRSYRRFHQEAPVDIKALQSLIDLARLSASGANRQPLKYILCCDPVVNEKVFPHLAWAGYLKDWAGPVQGERPAAYIIILGDTEISPAFGVDHGIAAQSIMLGAAERGLGGCMIASIDHDPLRQALDIPKRYKILLALALGKPKEEVVVKEIDSEGSIRYYRDEQGVHHVPKRSLEQLILKTYGG